MYLFSAIFLISNLNRKLENLSNILRDLNEHFNYVQHDAFPLL